MQPGDEVLVSVHRGEDRAGIVREADGRLWLAHGRAPALHAITALDGLEPAQIGGPGWTAVGGALPPAARTAHARGSDGGWEPAATGGGTWIAFVVADERHALPAVRFRDEHGALVSRAAPDVRAAARRIDTAEAERLTRLGTSVGGVCPVCEARDWRATPSAAGLGEHVFCGICGHSDGGAIGTWSPTRASPWRDGSPEAGG
jgi:hypothetical protein